MILAAARRACKLFCSLALLVTGPAVAESLEIIKPLDLYGKKILFDVFRSGEQIGHHQIDFFDNGINLKVSSTVRLRLNFLALFSYRYDYRSEAMWTDGQLDELEAMVDDDGEKSSVSAMRLGSRFNVKHGEHLYTTLAPLMPTNHWNSAVLKEKRVLNTLTGQINNVRLVPKVRESVETEHGSIMSTRYAYTGDLDTEVWYDDLGRWVKLRFRGSDGTPIEYICRRCQGALKEDFKN